MEKGTIKKISGSKLKNQKKKALGRGLEALIPDRDFIEVDKNLYFQCDINRIRPNRYQPRVMFSEEEMKALGNSVKKQGIIQPLLVRKNDSGYELVAGERRLRAAKMVGLEKVPVIIKNITNGEMLELSIVENIQREDLNPMEEAEAYHRLITEFDMTQDQVALRVGKSRSAVANYVRLLKLSEQIKADIKRGIISMGHARALLGADSSAQQNMAWRLIVSKNLSVRQTEALIKRMKSKREKTETSLENSEDIYLKDCAEDLARFFGTKVWIKRSGKKGRVEIEFYSNDDLDRLLTLLKDGH